MIVVNKIRSWKQCFCHKYLPPFYCLVLMNTIQNMGTYHVLYVPMCKVNIFAV